MKPPTHAVTFASPEDAERVRRHVRSEATWTFAWGLVAGVLIGALAVGAWANHLIRQL